MLNWLRQKLKIGPGDGRRNLRRALPPHDIERYHMVCETLGVALWEMDVIIG